MKRQLIKDIYADKEAFAGNKYLETVIVPENVKSIGSLAFAGCKNLRKLKLTNPDTIIEAGALAGCAGG